MNEPRAIIDFETRSECELRKHGSWRYSLDPTTRVMCLAFRLPYWSESEFGLWHPAFPQFDIPEDDMFGNLDELLEWVMEGSLLVEAHNAWFERGSLDEHPRAAVRLSVRSRIVSGDVQRREGRSTRVTPSFGRCRARAEAADSEGRRRPRPDEEDGEAAEGAQGRVV
jgi:hypothetical protein